MYTSTPSSASATPLTEGTVISTLEGHESMQRSGDSSAMLDSVELLRGNKAVTIQHNGAVYRLQSTKLGKLILTK